LSFFGGSWGIHAPDKGVCVLAFRPGFAKSRKRNPWLKPFPRPAIQGHKCPCSLRTKNHATRCMDISRNIFWAQAASFLAVQQSGAVDYIAIHNQIGDAAGVPDVYGWIAIDYENVGAAAGNDLAQFIPSELK
jgi:hypothetical protein